MATINPRRTGQSLLNAKAPITSSSPAFGTPVHPIVPHDVNPIPAPAAIRPIIPILLPPNLLRPVAVRVFTRNHNLNLKSNALASLATFVGRHCGKGWKEDGLAERVLEEVARSWKKAGGPVIVDNDGELFKNILKSLESCMVGGRVAQSKGGTPSVSRQGSFQFGPDAPTQAGLPVRPGLSSETSFGISTLQVDDKADEDEASKDPRDWIKVISAFEQPRLVYHVGKKHFEKSATKPSLLPPPSHRVESFRQRYHIVHQRILRNEAFQVPTFTAATRKTGLQSTGADAGYNKITPISNLLGRGGSTHLLLGLLTISPTGTLALSDLTGAIALDLQHARPVPDDGAWFAPGMLVLVDGSYEEDYSNPSAGSASALGGTGGIGGTIGGKFVGFSIGHPPVERRNTTLGITDATQPADASSGLAFGWTDFLGVGSERANGARMRRLQQRLLSPPVDVDDGSPPPAARSGTIAIAAELNLAEPSTITALRTMFSTYEALPISGYPLSIVLMGNFSKQAALSGAPQTGSIEYKEAFDSLATLITEFPQLFARTTLILVPGDNDAWLSSFSAGAAAPLPRQRIPEIFTSRVKRAVDSVNREVHGASATRKGIKEGEVIWTSNPSRLSWFGVAGDMVLLRDDLLGRLRRTAIRFKKQDDNAAEAEGQAATTQTEAGAEVTVMLPSSPPAELDVAEEEMEIDSLPSAPSKPAVDEQILTARALAFTMLSQSHLSPFPLTVRPQHWSYGSTLSLYPLPSVLVLADPEAPAYALSYAGCAVLNPGRCAKDTLRRSGRGARWVEWDIGGSGGRVREEG